MALIRKSTPDLLVTESQEPAPVIALHRGKDFHVATTLTLGVEPRFSYRWSAPKRFWDGGFRLFVFHNMRGFSTDRETRDFSRHGQMIVEAFDDGEREEHLGEGTHFYTLVLYKKRGFFGLTETLSEVRLSTTVPSAKIGIGRVRDRVELEQLIRDHHLGRKQYEVALAELKLRKANVKRALRDALSPTSGKKNDRPNSAVERELRRIDMLVETLHAKREKVEAVKRDARFEKLDDSEREMILKMIDDLLDVAEVSARNEAK